MFCGTHYTASKYIYIFCILYWITRCIELQNSEVFSNHQKRACTFDTCTFIYFTNWKYKIISYVYVLPLHCSFAHFPVRVPLYGSSQQNWEQLLLSQIISSSVRGSVVICKPRWEDAQLRSSVTGVCSSRRNLVKYIFSRYIIIINMYLYICNLDVFKYRLYQV